MIATVATFAFWLSACLCLAQDKLVQPPTLHPDVALLLAPEHRNEALLRILRRGVHRGPGTYRERAKQHEVHHVLVCEQRRGLPIFAVFVTVALRKGPNVPRDHLIKITADGAILRCWQGNNSIGDGTMADVNRDGIVERIETMNYRTKDGVTVRALFVLPITEQAQPVLRIAIEANATGDLLRPDTMGYRVLPATDETQARIQIGPVEANSKQLTKVTAEWRWHAKHRAWVGPNGGPNQPFLVLPPAGWGGIDE